MKKLQIREVCLGIKDKLNQYETLKKKYKLKDEEVCFCGDDIQDIQVLKRVGLSVCPKNASEKVKKICDYISTKRGGEGMIRELADLILKKY